MSATKHRGRTGRLPGSAQGGTSAVEFSLLAVIFFTFVFGIIEMARLLYVYNTLQEVTRRAAAAAVQVYPTDAAGTAAVRHHAIFRDGPGDLTLAPPITDDDIRLDYLRFDLSIVPPGTWPASAAENKRICTMNPRAANCIRFVRARVCDKEDASECNNVSSRMLLPLIDLRVPLHRATTISPVESFGYIPGTLPP